MAIQGLSWGCNKSFDGGGSYPKDWPGMESLLPRRVLHIDSRLESSVHHWL